jgi:hypothetical protein
MPIFLQSRLGKGVVGLLLAVSVSAAVYGVSRPRPVSRFGDTNPVTADECTSYKAPFFKTAAEVPDAPTVIRATIVRAMTIADLTNSDKRYASDYPLYGIVSVDEMVKGNVAAKQLFVNASSVGCVLMRVGDSGFLSGEVLARQPGDVSDAPSSLALRISNRK